MHEFIMGEPFIGAHDSLIDALAQTDIVTDKRFISFIDKNASIRLVSEIFTSREQSTMAKKLEPTCPIHNPWTELDFSRIHAEKIATRELATREAL